MPFKKRTDFEDFIADMISKVSTNEFEANMLKNVIKKKLEELDEDNFNDMRIGIEKLFVGGKKSSVFS